MLNVRPVRRAASQALMFRRVKAALMRWPLTWRVVLPLASVMWLFWCSYVAQIEAVGVEVGSRGFAAATGIWQRKPELEGEQLDV